MKGWIIAVCLAVTAVVPAVAQDDRLTETVKEVAIYRLPPFERAVRCTKYFDYDK